MCLRFGIVLVLFTAKVITEKCTTPNNEVADCVSLYSCPILTTALATHQNSSIEFVRKSSCGGTAVDPLVCCGSSSSLTRNTEKKTQSNNRRDLLPNRSYCGYQHADDYVNIRRGTAINEFPWLAGLLVEVDEKMQSIVCGGSLISDRYILTTAHCVVPSALGNLTGVRLGEYNVKTEKDCVGEHADLIECSEIQDYGIEQRIVHPEYNRRRRLNDIALLRLNRTVTYSDYIRPICLPAPGIKSAETGDELISSGWGLTDYLGAWADVKKKVLAKLITNDECKAASRQYRDVLTENHFCTLELDSGTEYSCQGDSGGPIMFSYRNQWQQEGILSFGVGCRSAGMPEVHVKVAKYLDWIKSNIKT